MDSPTPKLQLLSQAFFPTVKTGGDMSRTSSSPLSDHGLCSGVTGLIGSANLAPSHDSQALQIPLSSHSSDWFIANSPPNNPNRPLHPPQPPGVRWPYIFQSMETFGTRMIALPLGSNCLVSNIFSRLKPGEIQAKQATHPLSPWIMLWHAGTV